MEFEWDKAKAAANFKKHKATFDEASTVFGDPLARIFDDEEHSAEERREIILGHSILDRLLLVCLVEIDENTVRIFSARQATRKEHQHHEENANV
jgi:uncharacterized DUF497 family protein